MPQFARRAPLSWVQATLTLMVSASLSGQELKPSWDGEVLKTVSNLRFLGGKNLEAVRNGRAIPFDIQLSLHRGVSIAARTVERFVISYDLWEEKFSVARLSRDDTPRRQVSHLAQEGVEGWCLDNISVSTTALDPDTAYTVHLEVRAGDGRPAPQLLGEPGVSLTALIEMFSRPARAEQQKWNLQYGPIRLKDIRRKGT